MQSSTTSSKAEIIKPLLFKAGITLTLSFTAFVCARIVAKRSNVTKEVVSETNGDSLNTNSQLSCDDASFHNLSSTSSDMEEEILCLKGRIEDLQKRECELQARVVRYIDLKEQESMLMRFRDVMLLEISHIDLIDKEISLLEDESQRVEKFVVEYFRVLEKLECWKSESGLLQRQVKKLSRRIRVQSSLVQEKDLNIRAKEAELSRAREELELKTNVVKMLEDEASGLRFALDQLKEEKNELMNKLELGKISSFSEMESEESKVKMDQETEITELIYLRRNNERLEHELLKIQEQYQENDHNKNNCEIDFQENVEKGDNGLEHELDGNVSWHNGNEKGFGNANGDQACSTSKKLLKRLRKWVEGCGKRSHVRTFCIIF